ncbi:hypothetical protein [Veillonella sp. 3310]|uniref:hypothetical protein n=1 Tax=Veillonella sp. 3310 TaxID=2490956 RepID=UPI000FD6612F|nr:hypothetical protein [Veillonella sp. 3310]
MTDFFSRYNKQVKDDLAIIDIAITNVYKEMKKAKQHALENGIDVKPFDRLLSVYHAIDRTHAHIYTALQQFKLDIRTILVKVFDMYIYVDTLYHWYKLSGYSQLEQEIYNLYVLSKHLYDWTFRKHQAINAGGV